MRRLVAELLDPATTYELEALLPNDLVRALEIDAKFAQLRLGLVDGTVAAIAERRRIYRVLTTDRRDFVALSLRSAPWKQCSLSVSRRQPPKVSARSCSRWRSQASAPSGAAPQEPVGVQRIRESCCWVAR